MICGPRWAYELDELLPDSQLLVLEHSGHMGTWAHRGAELCAAAVRDFVLRCRRKRPARKKGPHRLPLAKTLHTVGTTGFEPATP
nr:hypothetical protein [Streptomyces sp. MK7]